MKTNNYYIIANEQYKVMFKCRIAGVDNALGYTGVSACLSYLKAIYVELPEVNSNKYLKGTRMLDLYREISKYIVIESVNEDKIVRLEALLNKGDTVLTTKEHTMVEEAVNALRKIADDLCSGDEVK